MFQGNITGGKKLCHFRVSILCALFLEYHSICGMNLKRLSHMAQHRSYFKCIYIFSPVLLLSGIVEHIICPGHERPPPLKATCCFCSCAIWATCWRKHVKNVSVRLSCPGRGGSGPTRHPHVVADCGVWRGALLRAAVGRLRVRICPTIPPVFLASLLAVRT